MSAHWPDGLTPETPLPYRLWRVMDAIDGKRDLTGTASIVGMSEADVRSALEEVRTLVNRVAERAQPISERTAALVKQCLVSVVGPMANLMMDEADEDLGDNPSLTELLQYLHGQLSAAQREPFTRQLQAQGLI